MLEYGLHLVYDRNLFPHCFGQNFRQSSSAILDKFSGVSNFAEFRFLPKLEILFRSYTSTCTFAITHQHPSTHCEVG